MSDDIHKCDDLDERLAPYVDGEASPESRRLVDAHLGSCPTCRTRAEAEAAARTIVRSQRDSLSAHAPETLRVRCAETATRHSPIPIDNHHSPISTDNQHSSMPTDNQQSAIQSSIAARRSAIRGWVPLSLAASVLLAVGGVFLFGLNDRVEALAATLAIDHVKCFKTANRSSTADPTEAESRWQQNQGWPITVPQTEPSEQLRLVTVRRCFTTDGRAAHLMYVWRGAPLSVYVLQENAGRDRICDRMGREAVIWCTNGRTYAVVADGHPPDLPHIVDYMKARVH
jgi:anti-sigma factor RsiW